MDKWDKRFLNIAKEISTWSKDPSTKVGALIVSEDKDIVSTGYNGFPRGVSDSEDEYIDRDMKYKKVVHAEINAIIRAKKDLKNHILYVYPIQCCSTCAAAIIQSGIKKVVALDTKHHSLNKIFEISNDMFKQAGIDVIIYPQEYFEIDNNDYGGNCC